MIFIKRLTIILLILVAVVTLCITSIFYLKSVTRKTASALETATEKSDIEAIMKSWDKDKKIIGLFVHEELVNEITDHLESCYANADTDLFKAEINKTELSLYELYEKTLPTFYNIF